MPTYAPVPLVEPLVYGLLCPWPYSSTFCLAHRHDGEHPKV
jgi:hypothetical protein